MGCFGTKSRGGFIVQRIQSSKVRLGLEDLGGLMYRMAVGIVEAREAIKKGNSWWSKLKDHLIGGLVGAVIGVGVTLLAQWAIAWSQQ